MTESVSRGRARRPSVRKRTAGPALCRRAATAWIAVGDRLDHWRAGVARSALNRVADQAGRYRRVALCLLLVAAPLAEMGLIAAGSGHRIGYGLAHLVLAGSCVWGATDLAQQGSLVDERSRPHRSALAVVTSVGLVGVLQPADFEGGFGYHGWAGPAIALLSAALAFLVVADRRSGLAAALAGRYLLVAGAFGLGTVTWVRAMRSVGTEPGYAAGMAATATILIAMSIFEGRLLLRGLALFRVRARRETRA